MDFNAFANDQVEVKPFIRMDYQVVRNNHYQECGVGVLNLKVDADTNQSLISKVGVDTRVRVADKLSVGARASVGYDASARKGYIEHTPSVTFKMAF